MGNWVSLSSCDWIFLTAAMFTVVIFAEDSREKSDSAATSFSVG